MKTKCSHLLKPCLHRVFQKKNFHVPAEKNYTDVLGRRIFHSLESIKEFFNDPKQKNKVLFKEMLDIYYESMDEAKYFRELELTNQKKLPKFPLIVFEGLDGTGKSTNARKLASFLKSEYYHTPPLTLNDIKSKFTTLSVLERTACYTLGNYLAGIDLLQLLRCNMVVLDRFWHSTTAYALAQEIKDNPTRYNLPHKEDDIYLWPRDLVKPDVVLLLYVPEDVRRFRQFSRRNMTRQEHLLNTNKEYRQNAIEAYLRMKNPGVIPIDSNAHQDEVFQRIKDVIEPLGVLNE